MYIYKKFHHLTAVSIRQHLFNLRIQQLLKLVRLAIKGLLALIWQLKAFCHCSDHKIWCCIQIYEDEEFSRRCIIMIIKSRKQKRKQIDSLIFSNVSWAHCWASFPWSNNIMKFYLCCMLYLKTVHLLLWTLIVYSENANGHLSKFYWFVSFIHGSFVFKVKWKWL